MTVSTISADNSKNTAPDLSVRVSPRERSAPVMSSQQYHLDRRFVRVSEALQRGPIRSKAKIYQLAAKHEGLLLKYDSITFVDLQRYDQILEAMPAAELGRTPGAGGRAGVPPGAHHA